MTETFWSTTEEYIKRGWSDIAPKLMAGALSGSLADGILSVAQSYHVNITPQLAQMIPFGVAMIGGYIAKDKAKVQTKTIHLDSSTTMEKTVTGPIPIPKRSTFTDTVIDPKPESSGAQAAAPAKSWVADAVTRQTNPGDTVKVPVSSFEPVFAPAPASPDDQATQVLR